MSRFFFIYFTIAGINKKLFVIPRTSLYRGSLYRGSTVYVLLIFNKPNAALKAT